MSGAGDRPFEDKSPPPNLDLIENRRPFLVEMDEFLLNRSVFSSLVDQDKDNSDLSKISASHDLWIQQFLTECVVSSDAHAKIHLMDIEVFRTKLSVGRKVFKDFKTLVKFEFEDNGISSSSCISALLAILRFADLWSATTITHQPNSIPMLIGAMTFFQHQGISSPSDLNLIVPSLAYFGSKANQTIEDIAFSYQCDNSLIQIAGAARGHLIRNNSYISDGVRKEIIQFFDSIELTSSSVHFFGPPDQEILLSFNEVLMKKPVHSVKAKNPEVIRLKTIVQQLGTSIELIELIIESLDITATQRGIKGAVSLNDFSQIESRFKSLETDSKDYFSDDKDVISQTKARISVSELAKLLGMTDTEMLQLCRTNNVAAKSSGSTLVEAFVPMIKRKAKAAGLVRSVDAPATSRAKVERIKACDLAQLLGLSNAEILNLCEDCRIKAPTAQSRIPTSFIPLLRRQLTISPLAKAASSSVTRSTMLTSTPTPEANTRSKDSSEITLNTYVSGRLRISKLAKELKHTPAEIKRTCDQHNITYTKMGLILESDFPRLINGLKHLETIGSASISGASLFNTRPEEQETKTLNQFIHQDYNHLNFSESELSNSRFEESNFILAVFVGANLKKSEITKCDFRRIEGFCCDFSDCTISDSSFDYSDLEGAIFRDSKLTNVTFKDCNLHDADFTGAQLVNTSIPIIDSGSELM